MCVFRCHWDKKASHCRRLVKTKATKVHSKPPLTDIICSTFCFGEGACTFLRERLFTSGRFLLEINGNKDEFLSLDIIAHLDDYSQSKFPFKRLVSLYFVQNILEDTDITLNLTRAAPGAVTVLS